MTHALARRLAVVAAMATIVACTNNDDAVKVPLGQATLGDSVRAVAAAHALIGPAARVALDSGNAYYRRKAYAAALAEYRAASVLAPQHAAPFFGIYMVARATNNAAMADSALSDIRRRNGPMQPLSHSRSDSVLERVHEAARKKTTL
ncbi:MAG: hypothetical protein ABI664_00585 [bacterium]